MAMSVCNECYQMHVSCNSVDNGLYVPVNYDGNALGLQEGNTTPTNFVLITTNKFGKIYNESRVNQVTVSTAANIGLESSDTTLYVDLNGVFYNIGNLYFEGSYKIEFYTDQVLTDKFTLYINGETYTCIEITFDQ